VLHSQQKAVFHKFYLFPSKNFKRVFHIDISKTLILRSSFKKGDSFAAESYFAQGLSFLFFSLKNFKRVFQVDISKTLILRCSFKKGDSFAAESSFAQIYLFPSRTSFLFKKLFSKLIEN